MLKNFFKIAFRNITKHKSFSIVNIAGLTLGLTACILMGLFVWDENQYDKFIPGGEQVYRIYNESSNKENTQMLSVTPPMYATTLQQSFPEVKQTTRVMMQAPYKMLFETSKKKLYEESGFFVDSTFLEIFPLSFKHGSPIRALDDHSSIILSEEMSERLFGQENPVGKEILVERSPLQVKGVFEKNPRFHLQFNYLRPLAVLRLPPERMQSWRWQQFFNYVKVKPGTNSEALEAKFQKIVHEKSEALRKELQIINKPFFQPLKDIHLYSSNFKFDMAQRGNITYVKALTIIAIFVLLIACFNFINLSTAKSLQRAKEVGVRKAIGAERKNLLLQFIGETLLLAFISILISVAFAWLLLPWLNNFTGKQISSALFGNPVFLFLILGLTISVGVLAGFYPALVLSAFKPVRVLKAGTANNESPGKIPWLRHGLVIVQFTISVLLIISALIVVRQVDYLHGKDLGFNKDQIMFFPMRGDSLFKHYEAFKNELTQSPGISSVSIGYGFPGDAVAGDEITVMRNGRLVTQPSTHLIADHDYVRTLRLQIIAGRDFSKEMKTDLDKAFIINETAVKELGFETPEKALGQTLYWHPWGASNPDSMKIGSVIGVVKDFNYKSLYDKVETTVIQIFPDAAWKVAVKMKTAGITNTIKYVERSWNKFTPEYPLEYKFLDENFEKMYNAEDKMKSLLGLFTLLAIFIGCLGLFGLAAYTAERRRKEIGIRKILGASVQGLVLMLSKDFIKLVLISLLIASPVAWYFMNDWLQDFAYRIHISSWIFIVAAIVAIGIALFTVSFQAIKASLMNPVKSLRME